MASSGSLSALLRGIAVMSFAVGVPCSAQRNDMASASTAEVKRVTIDVDNVPLVTALGIIVRQAALNPAYEAAVIPSKARVSLHLRNVPVTTALEEALRGTTLVAHFPAPGQITIVRTEVASGIIRGTVKDDKTNRPMAGVAVTLDGTNLSAHTGDDGVYRFPNVPAGKYTVVVRRLGYAVARKTVTVADGASQMVDVTLSAASTPLQEVVTTVTGRQRKVEIGNDISVINADSLVKAAPITTLSELLMSRVPGLSVRQGQGTVGGDVRLQIRGPSSIALSNEPIVVVDGVRYNSRPASRALQTTGNLFAGTGGLGEPVSPLNDLNPNEIETVEVVKGPSAATLYGADAANGVIVITTKRGRSGPARWNMYATRDYTKIPHEQLVTDDLYYGWGTRTNGSKISTCTINERLRNRCRLDSLVVQGSINTNETLSFYKPTYPWTAGANVSGGPQTLRYFVGGSYTNAEGAISIPDTIQSLLHVAGSVLPKDFLRPNGQTMLNLSSNVTAAAGTKVDLTIGGNYTRANTRSIEANASPFQDLRAGAIDPQTGVTRLTNSVANFFSGVSEEVNDRFFSNATGLVRLTPWLALNGVVGLDHASRNVTEFRERDSTSLVNTLGRAYNRDGTFSVLTANTGASATARRGRLSAQTSFGVQYTRSTDAVLEGFGEDLVPGTQSVAFAAVQWVTPSYSQVISLGSYAEQRLGWNERLFLTAAVRADGSSAFGDGYHAKGYPKFSLSWLVSQEPLLPRIPGLTELRLRSAYGVAGRQPGATDKLPLLSVQQAGGACIVNERCLTQTIGNSALRPERSAEVEGGLDAGLIDQRVQLGLSWYSRRTRDQILNQTLPSGLGTWLTNIGLTSQRGFEAQMTASLIETQPLSLAVTMTHSNYRSTLIDLGDAQPKKNNLGGGYDKGYPLGALFIVPFRGYQDKNGDGKLYQGGQTEAANEIFFGSNDPDSLVYAGVVEPPRKQNLMLMLGLWSNRLRLSANLAREGGSTMLLKGCARCKGSYDTTASLAEQAFAIRMRSPSGIPVSATYTRLREVSAAVTLPVQLLHRLRASSGTIALSARNLGLWTSSKMPDPESAAMGIPGVVTSTASGIGIGVPQAQRWALRVDLGL